MPEITHGAWEPIPETSTVSSKHKQAITYLLASIQSSRLTMATVQNRTQKTQRDHCIYNS